VARDGGGEAAGCGAGDATGAGDFPGRWRASGSGVGDFSGGAGPRSHELHARSLHVHSCGAPKRVNSERSRRGSSAGAAEGG